MCLALLMAQQRAAQKVAQVLAQTLVQMLAQMLAHCWAQMALRAMAVSCWHQSSQCLSMLGLLCADVSWVAALHCTSDACKRFMQCLCHETQFVLQRSRDDACHACTAQCRQLKPRQPTATCLNVGQRLSDHQSCVADMPAGPCAPACIASCMAGSTQLCQRIGACLGHYKADKISGGTACHSLCQPSSHVQAPAELPSTCDVVLSVCHI
jgi:hypothetical protein